MGAYLQAGCQLEGGETLQQVAGVKQRAERPESLPTGGVPAGKPLAVLSRRDAAGVPAGKPLAALSRRDAAGMPAGRPLAALSRKDAPEVSKSACPGAGLARPGVCTCMQEFKQAQAASPAQAASGCMEGKKMNVTQST